MNKLITYVFEITDEAAWRKAGNPFNAMDCENAQLPGLKCVGVSAGDLMAVSDDFEQADIEAYEKSHKENVMKYFRPN